MPPELPVDSHWNDFARRWQLIGAPLRPSLKDLEVVSDFVSQFVIENPRRSLRVLVLGVTPEYARFPWPPRTTLIACERSESMIRHVWPGSTLDTAYVIHGNWLDMTRELGKFDLILGDGILTQLAYHNEYDELGRRVSTLLQPGGRLILRLFASSGQLETPEDVLNDARLNNVNEFKLRLGMALSIKRATFEVGVDEIWSVWDQARRTQPALNTRWSAEAASTIDAYRGSVATYSFPPLNRIQATLCRHLKVAKVFIPNYEFGNSCPTMILQV